jgi:lysophospholipase L1-like esterase
MSIGFSLSAPALSWAKSRPGRVAAWAGAVVLCSGLAFWAGTRQVRGLSSEAYAEQRLPLINAHLDEARKGFIFLAGDSHSEYFNASYRLCGREIVNGGISGAKAELYRDVAKQLQFGTRPDIVVLTIGTNNIQRKKDPLSSGPIAEFERNVSDTLASFRKVAKRVVVTALPPVSPSLKNNIEIQAVAAYSERLRNLCARQGCEFMDPYSDTREADGSTAQPGAMRDGLHMNSYRSAQARLGMLLCPGGSL